MSLDSTAVRTIANLARIEIREDDIDRLAGELSGILAFVEQLAQVNTDGIEPMASVADLTLPLREDKVTDGAQVAAVLANAPEGVEGFFTVPKVIE